MISLELVRDNWTKAKPYHKSPTGSNQNQFWGSSLTARFTLIRSWWSKDRELKANTLFTELGWNMNKELSDDFPFQFVHLGIQGSKFFDNLHSAGPAPDKLCYTCIGNECTHGKTHFLKKCLKGTLFLENFSNYQIESPPLPSPVKSAPIFFQRVIH